MGRGFGFDSIEKILEAKEAVFLAILGEAIFGTHRQIVGQHRFDAGANMIAIKSLLFFLIDDELDFRFAEIDEPFALDIEFVMRVAVEDLDDEGGNPADYGIFATERGELPGLHSS